MMNLSHGLYDKPEYRESAVKTAQLIMTENRLIRQYLRGNDAPSKATNSVSRNNSDNAFQNNAERFVYDIGIKLNDSDKTFSG